MQTRIIYEDTHIMVCYKPAGLATQTAQVGRPDMVSELKRYLTARQGTVRGEVPMQGAGADHSVSGKSVTGKQSKAGVPYLGIIHRLDQPVEGLLVFAKTKEAAAKLTAQLSEGSLNKQYYAAVCGKPAQEAGELVDYLLKEKDMARVSENGAADGAAKRAVLQYQVITSVMTEMSDYISLLDIQIDTGRFHQIRVQMSHAGLPLLGDRKYGSVQSGELSRRLGICSVALYAYGVELVHPMTGKRLEFHIKPKLPDAFGNIS